MSKKDSAKALALVLTSAGKRISEVNEQLPTDLRVDGKCYPDSDEDHVGLILDNALDHLDEAIRALDLFAGGDGEPYNNTPA